MTATLTTPPAGDRQHVPTDQAAPELCVGTISTDRHPVVRYRAGWDCGDTFGADSNYDGLALTIEVADAADAQAMLAAISRRADLAAPSAPPVGEDWREIEQGHQPRLTDGYTAVRVSKPGFWFVKGAGPATAQSAPSAPAEVDDGRPMNTDVFLGKLFEACEDLWERCEAINEWLHGDWPAALEYLEGEA